MKIREKELSVPIIQGGMGVGISLGNLAGHVALNGGMGIISSAHPGYLYDGFYEDTLNVNLKALDLEIQKAKKISKGNGLVGVNIMVAINDYEKMVNQAIASKADVIISGAGLPLSLPKYTKGHDILIAPIVSSGRVASLICRTWHKKYQTIPDFIVIEGSEAGGHLGFDVNDVLTHSTMSLKEILKEVLEAIEPFEKMYNTTIPVFVAGGIYTGKDIAKYIKLGASGVQMATRFIATHECDAHINYKKQFIEAKDEDIVIVKSPVGMPGRAIKNKFVSRVLEGEKIPLTRCFNCLKPCKPSETPYCISMALINAASGNVDEGLIFCGSNGSRIKEIVHVEDLMNELTKECEENL